MRALIGAVDWVAVQGIATAVQAVILVVTVYVAVRQLKQAQLLRADQLQPHVIVDIEPEQSGFIFDFVVRNIGVSTARNVRFVMDPPLETTFDDTGYALGRSELFRVGIPTLPPGREIRSSFDSIPDRRDKGLPMRFTAQVSFDDATGHHHEETYVIDLSVYLGLLHTSRKDSHDAAEALQDIAKSMKRWTMNLRGLYVFTEDYRSFAWRNGYLREHPKLLPRLWHRLVKKVGGIDLHPREVRRRARERRSASTSSGA